MGHRREEKGAESEIQKCLLIPELQSWTFLNFQISPWLRDCSASRSLDSGHEQCQRWSGCVQVTGNQRPCSIFELEPEPENPVSWLVPACCQPIGGKNFLVPSASWIEHGQKKGFLTKGHTNTKEGVCLKNWKLLGSEKGNYLLVSTGTEETSEKTRLSSRESAARSLHQQDSTSAHKWAQELPAFNFQLYRGRGLIQKWKFPDLKFLCV